MVGNAVPPNLAYYLAKKIIEDLESVYPSKTLKLATGNSHSYENSYIPEIQVVSS
jgi:hypothetical protein